MAWKLKAWFREFSINFLGLGVKFGPPQSSTTSSFAEMLRAELSRFTVDDFWITEALKKEDQSLPWRYFGKLAEKLNMIGQEDMLQNQLLSLQRRGLVQNWPREKGVLWRLTIFGQQVREEYDQQQVN